jgi:hypothetical protein
VEVLLNCALSDLRLLRPPACSPVSASPCRRTTRARPGSDAQASAASSRISKLGIVGGRYLDRLNKVLALPTSLYPLGWATGSGNGSTGRRAEPHQPAGAGLGQRDGGREYYLLPPRRVNLSATRKF